MLLSMDAGDHLAALPKLEYYKVKALRFTPLWEGGPPGPPSFAPPPPEARRQSSTCCVPV